MEAEMPGEPLADSFFSAAINLLDVDGPEPR